MKRCAIAICAALAAAVPAKGDPLADAEFEWDVKREKSPLDDSPQVTALLPAADKGGVLILRCRENRTDVMFVPYRGFLGTRDRVSVTYRVDAEKAVAASWGPSTDGSMAFAPNAIRFIRALADDGKLFVRAIGYRGQAYNASFHLGQLSAVRDEIAAACNWPTQRGG